MKLYMIKRLIGSVYLGSIVGILGLIISGLTTYEHKSLIDLFTGEVDNIVILIIGGMTFMSSIRMTLHGILRHRMYINTVRYFFENVCMEKLEYWDRNYDKNEMVKCILTDISIYVNTISRIYGILLKTTLTITIILYLLWKESYIYVILGICLCIMRSIVLEKIARKWEKKLDKVTEIKNELEKDMSEYINNNSQMQIYGMEKIYKKFMDDTLEKYEENQKIEAIWYGILMLSFGVVQRFIEVGIYIISEMKIKEITFYDSQLILIYFKLLTESVQSISDIPKEISRNKDNINRLERYIIKNEIDKIEKKTDIKEPVIKFNKIRFKYYNREKYILENFSRRINYKDKVVLVGESGKGKSTIIKLLLGLYRPENGYVKINKRRVDRLGRDDINKIISIVPQEPIILENRTIRENINLFVNREIDDKEIDNILEKTRLKELIDNKDEKIITLSGGQKQRLAIIRAILNNAEIIILDEPFTGLDEETKREMIELMFEFVREKTLIMITHEQSTIKKLQEKYKTKTIKLN